MLNGKKITAGGEIDFAPDSVMTLDYSSGEFRSSAEEILSFPFLNAEGKPDFAVVVPADADGDTLALAENFRDYFRFCAKQKLCKPGRIDILRQIPQNRPYILLNFREKDVSEHGIFRHDDVITIAAPDSDRGDMLVRALSHVMDRRFEFFIGMGPTDGCPTAILEKFGFRGKTLPVKRCFEGGRK